MTQVDFYILADKASGDRYSLACRIADKAWSQGHRVYLHTNSEAESKHLDTLLWTYREGSFLPHGLFGQTDSEMTPVIIGHTENPGDEHDTLINLATTLPDFFSRFERVAELIDNDPHIKQTGRERFRIYRDRGYTLNTHTIN